MGADDIGQEWIVDCRNYNNAMNDMSPSSRTYFVEILCLHYNHELADCLIKCFVDELSDEEANARLASWQVQRPLAITSADVPNLDDALTPYSCNTPFKR